LFENENGEKCAISQSIETKQQIKKMIVFAKSNSVGIYEHAWRYAINDQCVFDGWLN